MMSEKRDWVEWLKMWGWAIIILFLIALVSWELDMPGKISEIITPPTLTSTTTSNLSQIKNIAKPHTFIVRLGYVEVCNSSGGCSVDYFDEKISFEKLYYVRVIDALNSSHRFHVLTDNVSQLKEYLQYTGSPYYLLQDEVLNDV